MEENYLKELISKGYSTRKIVSETGKAQTTIRYWLAKFNLKTAYPNFQKTWTDEQFVAAINNNTCGSDIMRDIGLKSAGTGNYQTLKKHASRLGMELPKGYKCIPRKKRSDDEVFTIGSAVSRHVAKKRLIEEGRGQFCEICYQPNLWNGKTLIMILDHKNKIFNDNRRENLRLICPKCNSTLETHCR